MHEILEVLVRLLAPILSFTADEIWQHMNNEKRSSSTHIELFKPVKEEYKDPELKDRWETILEVRRSVTKALELARKDKMIGHSLDASIWLCLPEGLMKALEPYKDQLRSVFIVSSVHLVPAEEMEGGLESEEIKGLRVKVSSSKDPKCERCWVHDPTVGDAERHLTLCKRCLEALAEMEIIAE
jgi:isoleucyl-tRNA synthetase